MDEIDIYAVGYLEAIRLQRRGMRGRVKSEFKRSLYWLRRREFRAVRNQFNGYLAEVTQGGLSAGRGWTKAAATRRLVRLMQAADQP